MSLEKHRSESRPVLRFAVITVSDTRDAATDRGGPRIVELLEAAGQRVARRALVKDEPYEIERAVRECLADAEVDLVLTTGGTGIAPRDQTVPTLERMFESAIPGFGELFRALSYREIGSAAILSRACAGVIVLPEAGHLVSQARGPAA